ncbi:PP0621 family protein [Polaromonas jejuensis]|uniref:PP0621 family protein n=1 Tax=Polaromonas jejuensis TaxID=457502 RepID=A0ABW0Q8H6_9BURK|nr:PP0621 family protein [Polaromonas jejuensis]
MKYLLVTALILVVFWLWRHNRQVERDEAARPQPRKPSSQAGAATEVVACSVCQVHLPRSEALIGAKGIYCSEAHRRQAGD